MPLRLLAVPYHLGREAKGMAAGPEAILAAGPGRLGDVAHIVRPGPPEPEIGACFAVNRALAAAVAESEKAGALPVTLAGNCHSAQATRAGLAAEEVGVVWFDAHADFHTPETTESGFFDGCALSIVVGDCFRALAATVPGHRPVAAENVVLVGTRANEASEEERLARAGVTRVAAADAESALPAALDALAARVRAVYLHVDLDVLDPAEGRANAYACPGGLTLAGLRAAIAAVAERFRIAAAALTAYDPAADPEGRIAAAAVRILEDLAPA